MEEKQEPHIEAESLLLLGRDAIERGAYVEALTLAYGIIYQFPRWGPAYSLKGWLFATVFNDLGKADASYREALALDPGHVPTYLDYAVFLNKQEAFDALTQLLNTALGVQGIDKVQVYHEFGIMYEKQGRYEEAAAAYLDAVRHTLKTEEVAYFEEAIYRCASKQKILAGSPRAGSRPFFDVETQPIFGA